VSAPRVTPETTGLDRAVTLVIETNVFGALAYHARCCACGWEGRRRDRERDAAAEGRRHGARHVEVQS